MSDKLLSTSATKRASERTSEAPAETDPDCGYSVLTGFSYQTCLAVFSALRYTYSATESTSFTLH